MWDCPHWKYYIYISVSELSTRKLVFQKDEILGHGHNFYTADENVFLWTEAARNVK